MYNAIDTAGTGLATYHTWLDVIANNIANVNDTTSASGTAFTEHYLRAGEITTSDGIGAGVQPETVTAKAGNGMLVQEPDNPLADARGYVRKADVNLGEQLGQMIAAQRAFQANADVVDRAKDVYEAAIQIGKGI